MCVNVDSFHYIPHAGSTEADKLPCSNETDNALRTQHSALIIEEGRVTVVPAQGAVSAMQCTCQPGAYTMLSFTLSSDAVLRWIDGGSNQMLNGSARCRRCPEGAICDGHALPPRSRAGFGVLTTKTGAGEPVLDANLELMKHLSDGHDAFYACMGEERCPGEDCDCLGGMLTVSNSTLVSVPMRCGTGYLAGSALCGLCDSELRYVNTLEECKECEWDPPWYLLISITVVVLWFPIMASLSEAAESLEISFNFLQFLGLYSEYSIEWPSRMQGVFDYMLFFNLECAAVSVSTPRPLCCAYVSHSDLCVCGPHGPCGALRLLSADVPEAAVSARASAAST